MTKHFIRPSTPHLGIAMLVALAILTPFGMRFVAPESEARNHKVIVQLEEEARIAREVPFVKVALPQSYATLEFSRNGEVRTVHIPVGKLSRIIADDALPTVFNVMNVNVDEAEVCIRND